MSNIYDVFRGVQAQKTSCFDERSAAFITEGALSTDITHVRRNTIIKASVTFNDKEGPDDAIVFTLRATPTSNELLKTDYFIYNGMYYLVYEDVKLTDSDLIWKKQRAVECNASFIIGNTTYRGYFVSTLRTEESSKLLKYVAIVSQEDPVLIVPTNSVFSVGLKIQIADKPFKIREYDSITNAGITYLYLERSHLTYTTAPTPPTPIENQLKSMYEYTFDTLDAYFVTDKKVNILERKSTSVKFMIPYGIDTISISVKDSEGVETTTYTVVL